MNAPVLARAVRAAPEPILLDAVLYGADAHVLAFMRQHLPDVIDWGPCAALGILRNGALIGGIVFNNYHPDIGDVLLSTAFDTSAWFRPRTLRRVFEFAFGHLRCRRLSVHTAKRNRAARTLAEKTGFRLEGVKRRGADGHQDLMMYGMLREECRFLPGA